MGCCDVDKFSVYTERKKISVGNFIYTFKRLETQNDTLLNKTARQAFVGQCKLFNDFMYIITFDG